MEEIGVQS